MASVRPLGHAGAEITDIDLANLSGDDFTIVRETFAERGLVVFREQQIDEHDHIELARRFGTINVNRFFAKHVDHPEIAVVAKEPEQSSNIGGAWHADHSYDAEPALGSILVARQLPPAGGDTLFASMYAAYESLDPEMRTFVDTHRAVHSGRHVFGHEAYYDDNTQDDFKGRIGNADVGDQLIDQVHPMAIEHPLSGKPALFVNPSFTIGIDGMDDVSAQEILQALYRHAKQDQHVERLEWSPGTVAIWDNRAVWHNAMNDYPGHRRVMHRITIDGCALTAVA